MWEKRVLQIRYSGKQTQYFPMKCSTCYCFGFLLCKTEMIIFTKETGMWWDWKNSSSTGGFSHPFLESMQGSFNTPKIPCFTKVGYPSVAFVHTSSCHGEDIYFCSKGIPWNLFVLLPWLFFSVSLQGEILQLLRLPFCWWWYLILDWTQAVLNSAFSAPVHQEPSPAMRVGLDWGAESTQGSSGKRLQHLQVIFSRSQPCSKCHRFFIFPFLCKALCWAAFQRICN